MLYEVIQSGVCLCVSDTQLYPTLCDPMDCSLPDLGPWNSLGRNIGVGNASLLQVSSWSKDQTRVSCIADGFFIVWATREAQNTL